MAPKKKVVEEKVKAAAEVAPAESDASTPKRRRRRSRGSARNKNSPAAASESGTDAPIYVPINVMDLLGHAGDESDDDSGSEAGGERVEFFSQEIASGGEKAKVPLAVLDYGSVAITTVTVTDKSGRTELWMDIIDDSEDAPVFEVDDETTEPPEAPRRKVLLCVLESGRVDQCHLDLIIPTDLDAFFYHTGKGTVYLTGASRLMDWDDLLYHSDSDSDEGSDDLEFSSSDEELTDKSALVDKIRKIAQLRKDAKDQGVVLSDDDSSDSELVDSMDSESDDSSSDEAGSRKALTDAFAKSAPSKTQNQAAPKADKKAAPAAKAAPKAAPKTAPKAAPKSAKTGDKKPEAKTAPAGGDKASPKQSAKAGDNKPSPKSAAPAGEHKASPKSATAAGDKKAESKSAPAGDRKTDSKSAPAGDKKASPKSAGDKKPVVTAFGASGAPKGKPLAEDKAKGKRTSDSPADGERPNKKHKGDKGGKKQ